MKIVIDDKIPYIRGAFEPVAEVVYLPGSKTTAAIVNDARAIVTRTRTICNEQLLSGSMVKMIATATIGYDHIDTAYCEKAGIRWTNAPGCNSGSVDQYIASALVVWAETQQLQLSDLCLGVVGVGNVGSKVARTAALLGMKVLKNDPPRKRNEGSSEFVDLNEIVEKADIITLHVPLETKGEEATYHLASTPFFEQLKRNPLLINSCRGEVVATAAVKNALSAGMIKAYIADCWENEPDIDAGLLDSTFLATPHIAGYSRDGKANGTLMSVRAVSEFFGLGLNNWEPSGVELPDRPLIRIDGMGLTQQEIITRAIIHTFDIRRDDADFRRQPADFETLRGDYAVRREFAAYTVLAQHLPAETEAILNELGFRVQNQ
jgi:erythronate-4-phosphate dehydrogenase